MSTTLLRVREGAMPEIGALRESLISLIRREDADGGLGRRVVDVQSPTFADGDLTGLCIHYLERKPPAWYTRDDVLEERHHVAFLLTKGTLAALTTSDGAFRSKVVTAIRRGRDDTLNALRLLLPTEVNAAFVGARVRTLWLSGVHSRTAIKADSKILTGMELEAALDPLGDQSYFFSSVRSSPPAASNLPSPVVGASPRSARVWVGRSDDWAKFAATVESLLDAAANVEVLDEHATPIPVLAQPLASIEGVKKAYEVAFIVPETVSAGEDDFDLDTRWRHEFGDAGRFVVIPDDDGPSFAAEVHWGDTKYGTIRYDVSSVTGGSLRMKVRPNDWRDDLPHAQDIAKLVASAEDLTIYYESGHTIARGVVYTMRFRDARFDGWNWAKLARFDVSKEKPSSENENGNSVFDPAKIGAADDDSLFGFVARHWPDLDGAAPARGWLACDDGSMESADFIHIDTEADPPCVSLIHVKGSGSASQERELSVSDYEIVVGQAVKNLRYLDRTNLAQKLRRGLDGAVGDAVWHDGQRQTDRAGFIAALETVEASAKRRVVVFQPRVRRSKLNEVAARLRPGRPDRQDTRILQALDALLLGARADCYALGAEFYVVGEDDGR